MRWLAIAVVAALATQGAADSTSRQRAEKLFQDGRKYLDNGEYQLACTAFERSQEAAPAIGTQLNIALCYEKWGKHAAAYRAYLVAERAARAAKDKRSTVARQRISDLEKKVARLRVIPPAGADGYTLYTLDGSEIAAAAFADELVLDPGRHVIGIRVAGVPPKEQTLDLVAGNSARVELDLPVAVKPVENPPAVKIPEPARAAAARPKQTRSGSKLYGGIALAAIGAGAMGVGGYVAIDARSDYRAAVERCPMGMCASLDDFQATQDAKQRARAMTWVVGGGFALAAVATYLLVTSKREVQVSPFVGGGTAGIAVGGTL